MHGMGQQGPNNKGKTVLSQMWLFSGLLFGALAYFAFLSPNSHC